MSNNSLFVIRDARVVAEPETKQVGDRTLVELRVAINPIGEKAKERYESMFVTLTYSGGLAERAARVPKGATISASGSLCLRSFEKDGQKRYAYEIPYPNDLVWNPFVQSEPKADEPPTKATKSGRKSAFDFA